MIVISLKSFCKTTILSKAVDSFEPLRQISSNLCTTIHASNSPFLISICWQSWRIRKTKLCVFQTLETTLSRGKGYRLFFPFKKMSNLSFDLVHSRYISVGGPVAIFKLNTVKQTVNYKFVFSFLRKLSGSNRLWSIKCSCMHGGLFRTMALLDNDFEYFYYLWRRSLSINARTPLNTIYWYPFTHLNGQKAHIEASYTESAHDRGNGYWSANSTADRKVKGWWPVQLRSLTGRRGWGETDIYMCLLFFIFIFLLLLGSV